MKDKDRDRDKERERADRDEALDRRRKKPKRFPRRKVCKFCAEKVLYIDYKNYRMLREFLSERGKIIPRRITGTCARHQRMLTMSIKRARDIALLVYTRR